MKKLFAVIAALLMTLPLFGVNKVNAESAAHPEYITAEEIKVMTENICNFVGDRTSFTDTIKTAADKLAGADSGSDSELVALGTTGVEFLDSVYVDAQVESFTTSVRVSKGFGYEQQDITSYNIFVRPKNFNDDKKTILITTNYSNLYGENFITKAMKASGALGSAATTALAIKLANYMSTPEFSVNSPYNFEFAFFSGTYEGNFGSQAFVRDHAKEIADNVILTINLERLGCGETYFYTDEADTPHGEFIEKFSDGYDVKEFPSIGRVLLPIQTVDDMDYSHYALMSDNATFLSNGMSCLELIGGDFTGLGDSEGGEKYLTNTGLDTYANLEKYHPDYAEKLSSAATYIIELTAKEELKDVCVGAATSYKVFTERWIAYVICLGVIIILILIMILIVNRFEKKYPVPASPKIKIAVFGKEFEDIDENDIVVDIKRNDDDVDPFEN